jgi:hypothetical protein
MTAPRGWPPRSEPPEPGWPDPGPTEPIPWATGLTLTAMMVAVTIALDLALTGALASTFSWLAAPANALIGLGLAPSLWMSRRNPLWRWMVAGIALGLVLAWLTLLINLAAHAGH